MFGDVGPFSLDFGKKLANSGGKSSICFRILPILARIWPMLGKFGRLWLEVVQLLAMLAKSVELRPIPGKVGRCWATSADAHAHIFRNHELAALRGGRVRIRPRGNVSALTFDASAARRDGAAKCKFKGFVLGFLFWGLPSKFGSLELVRALMEVAPKDDRYTWTDARTVRRRMATTSVHRLGVETAVGIPHNRLRPNLALSMLLSTTLT